MENTLTAPSAPKVLTSPVLPAQHAHVVTSSRRLLLWLYDKVHQDTMKALMAKVAPVADIVPVSSVEEAGTMLGLNAGFHFIISPGGQWLFGAISVRSKRPGVPIVVFENCDPFVQRKCMEAGAAFIAPHVDILKDFLIRHMPAPGSDLLPPPFSPYRVQRSPAYAEQQQVVWPQIGSVVYSEATRIKYTITGRLGEGGYAHVFKCTDFFGQSFVMKILKTFKPKHETEAEWQKEARFLLSLRHPNIIQIYDMFEYYGLYYLIVEECHGSLRQLVEQTGPLPVDQVIAIAGQMLSGLHHIHSHSVIHRDLQNDNILYVRTEPGSSSYQIKITDFGISKFNGQAGDSGLPAYTNIGRPYDVAPELIVAGYTTHQSDIYQVGLVLYYLYRGTPALGPDDGPSSQAIATGLARHRAESLGTPLGDCIARMLRRHADWRFRDSMEVWTELCRVQQLVNASLPQLHHHEQHLLPLPLLTTPHHTPRSAAPSGDPEMDVACSSPAASSSESFDKPAEGGGTHDIEAQSPLPREPEEGEERDMKNQSRPEEMHATVAP